MLLEGWQPSHNNQQPSHNNHLPIAINSQQLFQSDRFIISSIS